MLYGPSNTATSQTDTFDHSPDARITPGRRAPLMAARTPTPPTEMPLHHGHCPTTRVARAESDAGHAPEDPSRSKQPPATPAPRSCREPSRLVATRFARTREPPQLPKGNRVGRRPYNFLLSGPPAPVRGQRRRLPGSLVPKCPGIKAQSGATRCPLGVGREPGYSPRMAAADAGAEHRA